MLNFLCDGQGELSCPHDRSWFFSSSNRTLIYLQEKINSQLSQIETLNVDCRELEQRQKSSEEKIIFLESESGHSAKKIEELKAILVAKQSEVEDKQIALEEEKRRLEAEVRLRLNSKQSKQ